MIMGKCDPETVVAQLNLLHMWNLRSRTRKEGELSGLKSSDPWELSNSNRDRDDATVSRTTTDDDDPSEHRRSNDVEEGSYSNGNTTFPTENENTDSDSQSRRLPKGEGSHAKGRNRKMNSCKTHQELFPLFKRKEKESMKTVIFDDTLSSGKDELQRRSRITGMATGKPSRARKSKRVPSDRHTRLAPGNFLNDTSSGSSTQTPIGSQDATNERRVTKQSSGIAGGSQEQPIVIIDSSPVRTDDPEYLTPDSPPSPTQKRITIGPQNFFAPRKLLSTSDTVRRKVEEGDRPKWPNGDNQHVRGAQHSFVSAPFESPRRRQPKPPHEADPSRIFTAGSISCLRTSDVSQDGREPRYLIQAVISEEDAHAKFEETLKATGRPCPAISRVLSADHPTDVPGLSWNEQWRPRCASELLGNEASSLYLKEWLLALELKERDGHHPEGDTEFAPETSTTYSAGKGSQGTKRPQVIRTVDKPRKRRKRIDTDEESLGDWITSDEEESPVPLPLPSAYSEHEENGSEDDELGSTWRPRLSRLSRRCDELEDVNAPRVQTASDRLTNTILLTGPSGSGKTATVYACAEELGWEVFEVYPGIGKRNGSNLLSLVGDVGKNHIVNHPSRVPIPTTTAAVTTMTKHSSVAFKVKGGDTDRRGALSSSSSSESRLAGTRQSIILLEEVDILFSEDIHFWPTVVALIRESRRPVIMTCNDPTLVPSPGLPLQTILPFVACPPDLAVPYLQCIALKEGYVLSEAHVKASYSRRQSVDVLDTRDDLLRAATYPILLPDLRCAINSLQLQCQGSRGMNASGISSSMTGYTLQETLAEASTWDWRQHFRVDCLPTWSVTEPDDHRPERKLQHGAMSLSRISDSLSMIDSYLARRPTDSLQILGYSTGDSSDDELGYTCLQYKPEVEHLQGGIVIYNRDEAIASEAIDCAARVTGNGAGGRTDEGWKPPPSLTMKMSNHLARVSGVLEKIVPWVARQSVGAVVLDYEPWVRFIDRRDAEQEAAAMKEAETRTSARGMRTTRNSQRMQYERYFGLTEEERERLCGACGGEYRVGDSDM